MSNSKQTRAIRAQMIELGGATQPEPGSSEPMVEVKLLMPLSDVRRCGPLLYQWVELQLPSEPSEAGEDT